MASRKTYFGIGWPKDGPDPDSGAVGKADPDDRSAPTVVDDEKVAEGLRQLRSWYQGSDTQSSNPAADTSAPAPAPVPASASASAKPGTRPTAVGHATAPPAAAAAQVQRPVAPDPMRATMYGHDVHKFDLEAELAAQNERQQQLLQQPQQQPQQQPPPQQPPPPASTTALVVADPARQQEMYPQPGDGIPNPMGSSSSDSFQLARFGHGEAERLPPRPGRRSGAFEAPRPTRVPLASGLMFGGGLAALAAAVIFWLLQSGGSDSAATAPSAPPPAVPVVHAPPSMPAPAPAPERAATPSPVPQRPSMPATPTPIPAAPVAQPKTEQLRLSAAPAPARTHRHRDIKQAIEEPTEVGEAAAPPVADRETREPPGELKDIKPLSTDRQMKDVKEPKETRELEEAKELKEKKAPTPAKETKASKARSGDADSTLPPSLD
jgi:hypothetical protein